MEEFTKFLDNQKGCPWCNTVATLRKLDNGKFTIYCLGDDCPVYPETRMFHSEKDAIKAWNKRA